jgi:hypothetical protein
MIIEKTESTMIVKFSRKKSNDLVKWLKYMASMLNINISYSIKGGIFNNTITITMIGLNDDIIKLEHKIRAKLLYG